MKILISGASIAGPATAFFALRAGHEVTVVERATELRRGGYAIDVRGAALEVVDRMGLRERLRVLQTDTESNSLVDADGRRFGRLPRGFGVIDPDDLELLRGDLAGVIFDETRDGADYRFGERIASLTDDGGGVDVVFASGARGRYDLVVGADGVHSEVRRLAFGPDSSFTVHMGSAMAIGTIPNALGLVREQLSCNDVERVVTVKSANGDAEIKACLFFKSELASFDSEDVSAQKCQLIDAFAGASWRLPEIARMVAEAPDFYAAPTCQIRMDRHHAGRSVLVGDAGYCPSPLAGQGTSLALVGAYVLVHALSEAGEVPAALARYEAAMRAFVVKNQDLAKKIGGGFVARSRFELAVRNAMMRALPYLPASGFFVSQAMRGVRVAANAIELPA